MRNYLNDRKDPLPQPTFRTEHFHCLIYSLLSAMSKHEELLKRPIYGTNNSRVKKRNTKLITIVFDIPPELLATIQLKNPSTAHLGAGEKVPEEIQKIEPKQQIEKDPNISQASISCHLCDTVLQNGQEQRLHLKSLWHGYNLKQKLRGSFSVTEAEFEKLLDDLNESISGSESSESGNDDERNQSALITLLKKQTHITHANDDHEESTFKKGEKRPDKSPLIWFSTPVLPSNTSLGIYRALFTEPELEEREKLIEVIRRKQLAPIPSKPKIPDGSNGVPLPSTMTSPQLFLCMVGGGHFAAMIVSLAPKIGKKATGTEERQAIVIAHKTFHRYTTRRKQGGAQSANDSAKGAAHSAGASIRRYNEAALETEIRTLLGEWRDLIRSSQLVFVRATGNSNRRILFGPYDGQVLKQNDPRNRSFPFSTRRATQAELMRAFVELTRIKISHIDEAALAAASVAQAEREMKNARQQQQQPLPKHITTEPSKEIEEALLHTSQLQALIRRSKVPALLAYLSKNSISSDFSFHPPSTQHHAPTPLHFAASTNSPAVVLALLLKAGANPTILNGENHPSFDLSGDRATRDAFRVARSELGEDRWDWLAAHCPPPISKAEADKRAEQERVEAEKEENERRRVETEKIKSENQADDELWKGKKMTAVGKALGLGEKTGAERREEESRGLTSEMKLRVERERRARAAEERMKKIAGGASGAAGK